MQVSIPITESAGTVDAFSAALLKQQRDRKKAIRRVFKLRMKARDEIQRLIDFLDASDPYASTELEAQADDGPIDDNELEPSLCGVTVAAPNQRDDEFDRELDSSDYEPSLGSLEHTDQTTWAAGDRTDREPSLSGGGWTRVTDDREEDEQRLELV